MIENFYTRVASNDYKRAWEIVIDIEGYEIVIQDLLNNLSPTLDD